MLYTAQFKRRWAYRRNLSIGCHLALTRWVLINLLALTELACTSQRDFVRQNYVINKATPVYAIGFRYDFIAIKLSNGNYFNGFQPEVAMLLRSRNCNRCLIYAQNVKTMRNQYTETTSWDEYKIHLTDDEYDLLIKAYNSPMKEEVEYLERLIDAYNGRNGFTSR